MYLWFLTIVVLCKFMYFILFLKLRTCPFSRDQSKRNWEQIKGADEEVKQSEDAQQFEDNSGRVLPSHGPSPSSLPI